MTLSLIAAALIAQTTPPPAAPSRDATPAAAAEASAIARSAAIGRLLYRYDRAAWVASDAMTAKVPSDRLTGEGGWVIEPAADDALTVTFFRGSPASAGVQFVATVRDGKVVDGRVVSTATPLTTPQRMLALARAIGVAEATVRKYAPCTPAPFNTVVLPSARPDGPVAVYLLSAQTKGDAYPLGGHYRVVVGPDGKVLAARPYSVGCLTMAIPKLPAGAIPTGLFVNHLLDPVPTEIHVFTSYSARMPLFVGTPGKRIWVVKGGQITAAPQKPGS